ncbi:MAG: 7-cyano-7-deazaguanine synthase [Candidatus Omnitrophota bacterium]
MKALALFSGGLDSTLAVKVILNQGVEVIALHFLTPLSCTDAVHQEALRKKVQEQLEVELKIIKLADDYLEILKHPVFGYGRNLNPCIDCKILMLKHAKALLSETGASFVVTGEVLGQRPKSQHKDALGSIEKCSGLEGLLLRPLSAKLLPLTVVEEKGWIKREDLYGFQGRNRTPQINLAKQLGIQDYAQPAGGCLLTNPSFCPRVKDFLEKDGIDLHSLELLKWGKHFRITPTFKLVVGRDEAENKLLMEHIQKGDIIFEPQELPGPTAIGRGIINDEIKTLCSCIVARHTVSDGRQVKITITADDGVRQVVLASGIDEIRLKELLIQQEGYNSR